VGTREGKSKKIFFSLCVTTRGIKDGDFLFSPTFLLASLSMTKRVRQLEDPSQPAGADNADRCVFWSGEQNRWVDIISSWITEQDAWKDGSTRGFAISVEGDVCIPVNTESSIRVLIGPTSTRLSVRVRMAAPLWKELSCGWEQFSGQVRKMVLLRCNLVKDCPRRGTAKDCYTCATTGTSLSWGASVVCSVKKRLKEEEAKEKIEPE